MPAAERNHKVTRCVPLPVLPAPKLSLSGWARAMATRSLTDFTGSELVTTSRYGARVSSDTGAKSRIGSTGKSLNKAGENVKLGTTASSVWPSGAAFAAVVSATMTAAPPPARLSTMNCWPRFWLNFAANRRAWISVAPPGACGTMTRTGLLGKPAALCAIAQAGSSRSGATNAAAMADKRIRSYPSRGRTLFGEAELRGQRVEALLQQRHDAAGIEYAQDSLGERRHRVPRAFLGRVAHAPGLEVDLDLVALGEQLGRILQLEYRQPRGDGIA